MSNQSTAIVVAALCCAIVAGSTSSAEAHAFLRDATPAVGSVVATAPAAVAIDFTEGVEPAFSTIVVTDAAGTRVDDGRPHAGAVETRLVVGLKPLAPGRYLVAWRVVATDTHRTEGSFSFTVTPRP